VNEAWRDLQVGDRVRVVRLPSEWDQSGYRVMACTRRLYKRLIERRRPVRICQIDQWGLPWVRCRFRKNDGSWEHHFVAISDDSWVRVRSPKTITTTRK
jgi:hypothetical protein